MTVVVRAEDGRILCMTKGADSVIIPRLRTGQEELVKFTEEVLLEEATDGLRTLLLA
jgi:magnesium-transporting ATPase (P-type)